MRILVSEKLSENRFKTPEGYLICTNAILARTGKQTYLRREVFGDSCKDGDREVEVDRTAEEVFSPETLASFENKPLCVEHPDEDVNAENHNLLSVGYVRDVKKDVVDGNEVMTATLVITDKYGIDEVESGRKTDLSCGYDCDIIDDEHPQQRHIRGNHVAICERGRAGIARIVDSTPPRGYKVTGNNYAWELSGTAKDKKEAANKFVRKYPELDDIWGISELLNFMIQSNKDVERDTKLGYALHFDYDEYTKKFYIAFVEKKYRYDDSMKNMEDSMKKYAEDKYGRTYTLEEIDGGKVKARNMSGREKIFSGWKEAEEEFRSKGITILDSFYDIVEDSVKDSVKDKQLYAVEFSYDGDSWSNYLGHVNVRANSEQDALTKAKRWAVEHYDNPGFFKIASTKYTNVETIDSIKDAKYVIMHPRKNLYLTVGAKTWSDESDPMIKKFDSEKEAEEYAKKNTSNFKIAVFDSVKDMKVSHDNIREQPVYVMQSDVDKNLFFYIGKTHAMKEGEFTYAQYDMEGMTPDELRKDLEEHGWHKVARGPAPFIDEAPHEDRLWRVYLTGPSGVNNIMYVKADNEAMARKIAERNTDEEIIRITEYGNTPLAKIDKERILRNPNKYFDSEKKIEKIAKIVSKLK